MWKFALMIALRGVPVPPDLPFPPEPADSPAGAVAAAPELTLEEIALRAPVLADYLRDKNDADAYLKRLQKTYLPSHPLVLRTASRQKILGIRVEELAARYRRNPRSLEACQQPGILDSMRMIDRIDIELDMLRSRAGSNHPRVRVLRRFRDEHERNIEQILSGGIG